MRIENPVLIAKIGAPHGIKGEVRVKSFTDDPLALGDYGSLYSGDGRKFKLMRARLQKNLVIAKFKGVNFRDEAEALNGIELFIDRSMLPDDTEEDEYYVTDLIGMDVVDETGTKVGTIAAVPDFGAGDLLEITPAAGRGDKSWYLEFTLANVPSVDIAERRVTVHLPDSVSERDENS